MSQLPGSIKAKNIGIRRRKSLGWRSFDLQAPNVTAEDPNSMIASATMTAGNCVVTFPTACTTDSEHAIDYAIFGIPLVNNYGEAVKFTTPFCLMTQVEFIGCTGDRGANNEPHVAFGMGIGENASNFDDGTNQWMMGGLVIVGDQADPNMSMVRSKSSGAAGRARNITSNLGAASGTGLQHTSFYVGPAVGSLADAESVAINMNTGGYSGNSYAQDTSVTSYQYDHHNDDSHFQEDGQVYLYAFFGSYGETWDYCGGGTPPVLTCRLRYLVTSDPAGWGGTGT